MGALISFISLLVYLETSGDTTQQSVESHSLPFESSIGPVTNLRFFLGKSMSPSSQCSVLSGLNVGQTGCQKPVG